MSAVSGYFGKIPGRGDFVRAGLPRSFVAALDGWWQAVLPASQDALGPAWTAAWMEAPLWCFALAPGCCGPGAAVGLWVPSVDRAGRLFPLTLAVVGGEWPDVAQHGGFPRMAAEVALDAVEGDVTPDWLTLAVAAAAASGEGSGLAQPPPGHGTWWTTGGPLVAASMRTLPGLPGPAAFTAMLRDP